MILYARLLAAMVVIMFAVIFLVLGLVLGLMIRIPIIPATDFSPSDIKAVDMEQEAPVLAPKIDIPFEQDRTERVELVYLGGGWNRVMCWPSVGGIIINPHVSSVELDFLHLSRFEVTPRSSNADEEDAFCRQLRRTGGKWWIHYGDFTETDRRTRPRSEKEREELVLGWPEDGGVWVLRERNWNDLLRKPGLSRLTNAHTMEERCKAMEMSGAVYYANPKDCEYVKPLLDGFGEHEREPEHYYYYELPADNFDAFC